MDEKETRPWEPYIPTYVDMYYVDYRDDLSDNTKLLQDCIDKNSLYPISEYLDDWWEYPEAPYLEEMQNQMERGVSNGMMIGLMKSEMRCGPKTQATPSMTFYEILGLSQCSTPLG